MDITEASRVARIFGYYVTQGRDGIFIQRTRNGDCMALVKASGEIIPYHDEYDAQDHLVVKSLRGHF